MGGDDSEVYSWEAVLLEKMRIWNGEKKTEDRIEAEAGVSVSPELASAGLRGWWT